MKNKKLYKGTLDSPSMKLAISHGNTIREQDITVIHEIRERVGNQLEKQKRIKVFDRCILMNNEDGTRNEKLEDFLMSFEYQGRTILLEGYVVNGIEEKFI